MDIQQQKEILNDFIKDTNEYLDIIQSVFVGLSSRENKLEDRQNLDNFFRATFSIKGGAGMLGFRSLGRFAYKVEKFAKILRDHPIQVDSYLEIRFIKVCQFLKKELYILKPPLDWNTDKTEQMVAEIEPILQQIEFYLDMLII